MSAKFASLHGGLLARKGQATPALVPLPIVPGSSPFEYVDGPEPGCCRPLPGHREQASAADGRHSVASSAPQLEHELHLELGAEHRTHVSVRLNPEQLRRLKTAAAQLHLSQQKIVAEGLDRYLDKLAAEDLAGCRCLKAKG
jgi:hypothetical protein